MFSSGILFTFPGPTCDVLNWLRLYCLVYANMQVCGGIVFNMLRSFGMDMDVDMDLVEEGKQKYSDTNV